MGRDITKDIRQAVYSRDVGKCQVCQEDVSIELFECGHIIDRSVGGKADLNNLTAMCLRCNKVKPKHLNRGEFERWVQSREWEKTKIPVMSDDAISRFWFKVDRSGECWIWKGKLKRDGYGQFYPYSKHQGSFYPHRVSYFLQYGILPIGMYVLHNCHNRSCVNPAHLRLGSPKENALDIKKAGTHRNRGERKLTWQQACEIRLSYRVDSTTYQELADHYGVSDVTISKIIKWKAYREPNHWRKPDRARLATEEPLERLYYRIDKRINEDDAGCWIWSGFFYDNQPCISFLNTNKTVRRVLWSRYIGEVKDGLRVRNVCGNKSCANPHHCTLK